MGYRTGQASIQHQIQRGLTKPVLPIAVSMHTDCISNSVTLINDYVSLLSALFACIQVKKMVSQIIIILYVWFQVPHDTLKL